MGTDASVKWTGKRSVVRLWAHATGRASLPPPRVVGWTRPRRSAVADRTAQRSPARPLRVSAPPGLASLPPAPPQLGLQLGNHATPAYAARDAARRPGGRRRALRAQTPPGRAWREGGMSAEFGGEEVEARQAQPHLSSSDQPRSSCPTTPPTRAALHPSPLPETSLHLHVEDTSKRDPSRARVPSR